MTLGCPVGSVQLGWPDMRLPILYTMSWPERIPCSEKTWQRLDFIKMGDLTFKTPDNAKYPAMDLAYAAGRAGGTMTGVLSAANEQACLCWPFLPCSLIILSFGCISRGTR